MFDKTRIRRLRSFWRQVDRQRDTVAQAFYAGLFERRPELRAMFGADLRAQGTKLMATFNVVLDQLEHLDTLRPTLRELGRRHRDQWGVQPQHFDDVHVALWAALRQHMGARFTPEVDQVLGLLYARLVADMLDR